MFCLTDDAHNVYAVLTARTLNADLFIAARATEEGAERRILQAGATRVVNPYQLAGTWLAHLVVKPAIVNFFDTSVGGTSLRLDQTSLRSGSPLVGQTLTEATIRERWGSASSRFSAARRSCRIRRPISASRRKT